MRLARIVWTLALLISAGPLWASDSPVILIKDRFIDEPLVLDQPADYVLQNIHISHLRDQSAITLAGRISSVSISNGHFDNIDAGPLGQAAGLEAAGASVDQITVTDTTFTDAENQLVSLRDGTFGTVTFQHCSFKTTDEYLQRLYTQSPWRTSPPVMEFYNIDRLELLDNEYANTTIIIHASVKTVVLRGDFSKLRVESDKTQVIRLPVDGDIPPGVMPDDTQRAGGEALPQTPSATVETIPATAGVAPALLAEARTMLVNLRQAIRQCGFARISASS